MFPGNWTHNFCTANTMLYHWATGTILNRQKNNRQYIVYTDVQYRCNIFTFTFMHLADAFIQSDLHCIQVIHFRSVCVLPGNMFVTPGCLNHCEALEGVPVFCVPACFSGHGLHFPSCCVFISVYLVQLSSISCLVLCLCILRPSLLLSVWVVDKCHLLYFLWPLLGSLKDLKLHLDLLPYAYLCSFVTMLNK